MLSLKENKGLTQVNAIIGFQALGLPAHAKTIACSLKQVEVYLFASTVLKVKLAATFVISKS